MADVPPASAGVGSGMLNSARQVGCSVGLAVLGSLGVAAAARAWDAALVALPGTVRREAAAMVQRVAGGEGGAVASAVGPDAAAPAFAAFLAGDRVAVLAAGIALVAAAAVAGVRPAAGPRGRRAGG